MKFTKTWMARVACHITLLTLVGILIFGFNRSMQATVALDGTTFRVTGPYTHENLDVFLLHASAQDPRSFITLAEGLKQGVVRVTEKEQEQVNELQIDNTSDAYLFLQEGDRVQGGKQDRTIYASFVVPPRSGPMPLPAFCVEQSRWTAGSQGKEFAGTKNSALAPKEVRCAAKVNKDQGQVWHEVQNQKELAAQKDLADNTNSNLNQALDAPKVQDSVAPFAQALNQVVDEHADALGVVIAINGRVEEANFYPNHRLFCQQYPRLLQSYALQAVLAKDQAVPDRVLSATAVVRFIRLAEQDSKRAGLARGPDQSQNPVEGSRRIHQRLQQSNSVNQTSLISQLANDPALQFGNLGRQFGNSGGQFGNLGGQFGNLGGQFANLGGQFGIQGGQGGQFGLQGGNAQGGQASTLPAPPARISTRREEAINKDNHLEVVEAPRLCNCKTVYDGKLVHRQYISRGNPARP